MSAALVTGASRGIGRAIAFRLASDGLPVAINYRTDAEGAKQTVAMIESAGGTCVLAQGDVADPEQIDAIFSAAEELGEVGVLVNNAGIRRDGLLLKMKAGDWDDVLRTNLDAAFHTSKRALRAMLGARWGRIVNIASVVGVRGNAGQANYAAAKAGVIGFTATLAREVGAKGITVNAIAPGFVRTELTEGIDEARFTSGVPIRRAVTPEEVAAAVAFLASRDASAITGQVLCVDGGMTA